MTKKGVSLSSYFVAVDRTLESKIPDFIKLVLKIAGSRLCFYFQDRQQAENAKLSFAGLLTEESGEESDAKFFHWTDTLENYLPEAGIERGGVWTCRDETGYLNIITEYGMMGADYVRKRYYICVGADASREDSFNNHAMIVALFRWALQSDMLILHSAAVGINGKGVLIGARGGRGKSTLSVSCLLRGLDFTADDYVILNRRGALTARPLYRTVGLNPDMEKILQPKLPVLRKDIQRGGKLLLDASQKSFCESMSIRGILFPALEETGEVSIYRIPPGKAITQIVHSSLSQFDVRRELDLIREMLGRLDELPVYEIKLSRNPEKNAAAVEKFLERFS